MLCQPFLPPYQLSSLVLTFPLHIPLLSSLLGSSFACAMELQLIIESFPWLRWELTALKNLHSEKYTLFEQSWEDLQVFKEGPVNNSFRNCKTAETSD